MSYCNIGAALLGTAGKDVRSFGNLHFHCSFFFLDEDLTERGHGCEYLLEYLLLQSGGKCNSVKNISNQNAAHSVHH